MVYRRARLFAEGILLAAYASWIRRMRTTTSAFGPGPLTWAKMKKYLGLPTLSTAMILSDSAMASSGGSAPFDGTWSVRLVSTAGMCGSGASHTLTVQGGRVWSASSGASVTGQVAPNGAVRLAMQRGPASGTATGRLSLASGSGT